METIPASRSGHEKKNWISYLSQIELPVLAQSLKEITALTDSSTSSVSELTEVVLRDADLTSQVIRLSNTVFYNLSKRKVNTVSRAITLIGFDSVKSIAISSLLIETFINKSPRGHLLKALARALHAGVQARELLLSPESGRREEVFIAALLSHIGEMAFWCSRASQTEQMSEALTRMTSIEAQDLVLGMRFEQITRGLADKWHLGVLLKEVVSGRNTDSGLVKGIRMIVELVEVADAGWDSPGTRKNLQRLGQCLDTPEAALLEQLQENAKQAEELATYYGINDLVQQFPNADPKTPAAATEIHAKNPELQLNILRDLSAMLLEKPNLNVVLQTVVEGIHRAVGLPRVVLLMRARTQPYIFRAKLALGPQAEQWRKNFVLDLQNEAALPKSFLEEQHSLTHPNQFPKNADVAGGLGEMIDQAQGMYYCLRAGNRTIGIIYADFGAKSANVSDRSEAVLDEVYTAFCHFGQQAQFAIFQLQ